MLRVFLDWGFWAGVCFLAAFAHANDGRWVFASMAVVGVVLCAIIWKAGKP